ncbi:hypothetical protein D3C81_2159680 [compost metagenome]
MSHKFRVLSPSYGLKRLQAQGTASGRARRVPWQPPEDKKNYKSLEDGVRGMHRLERIVSPQKSLFFHVANGNKAIK